MGQPSGGVPDMAVKLAFSKKLQAVTNRIHSTSNVDEIILDVSRDICQLFEADRMTVYITHLKPGEGALTMKEIGKAAGRWRPRMLENNQEFSL